MRDFRFALRVARQNPGSTAAALLAITLGIGGATAMFSVIDGVLLRPLQAKDPQRIVELYQGSGTVSGGKLSMKDFLDWRSRAHSFQSMAIYHLLLTNVSGAESPRLVSTLSCDPALLTVLGVTPARGRGFIADENRPGREFEALLSWDFWKDYFGGDEGIVGRTIYLDRIPHRVIGVLPQGFQLAGEPAVSVWRPLPLDFNDPRNERPSRLYSGLARLAAGVTVGAANGELASIQAALVRMYPKEDQGTKASCVPWREAVTGDVRPALLLLLGAVACVLIIACGNTANLLLVRAAGRRTEMSIRIALGASRIQLMRQLLAESLLLSLTSALLGLGLAWSVVRVLRTLPDTKIPNSHQILLDWRTGLFAAALGIFTGILFGLAPAWRVSRNVNEALKQASSRSTETRAQKSFRTGLVSVEAALAVLLAIGSGLLIRSFLEIAKVSPGFDPKNLLTLTVSLTSAQFEGTGSGTRYVESVLEKVRALPGVRDAAFGSSLPLGITSGAGPVLVDRGDQDELHSPQVMFSYITPRYFQTLGISLIAGRDFDLHDNAQSSPVAIVNQTFVRTLLHGGNPLGRRTRYYLYKEWREIVGVVGDVPEESFEEGVAPEIYIPNAQIEHFWTNLVVRVIGDPKQVERAVKKKMAEVDPTVAAYPDRHTMADVITRTLGWRTFSTSLLGIFATVAIFLASVGIYAVIAYSVTQRTSEIGLRMALGAHSWDISWMVLRQGVVPAAVGAVAGVLAAAGASRWLQQLLFRVTTLDAWAYVISVALVIGVAAAACMVPAMRAASVDPNRALRDE